MRQNQKSCSALSTLFSVLFKPLPAKIFVNKRATNVLNDITRNSPLCSFVSFSIVSVTPFINYSESSRGLNIFIESFISSFNIISVNILEPETIDP